MVGPEDAKLRRREDNNSGVPICSTIEMGLMTPADDPQQQKDGNCYVLLYGVPQPSNPVTLAPGIGLLPLPYPLDVFDLAALGAVGFREWAALEPFIRGCACEIKSALDSATEPGLDTLNRAWLAVALLVLQGFTSAKGIAVSRYRWQDVPIPGSSASWIEPVDPSKRRARTDLPPFQGGLLDLHFRMLSAGDQPQEVSAACTDWLAEAFPVANVLVAENPSFYLALQAATDWRFAADARSAIARLWSGIEAIFGVSSELVFRISLLGASLTEPRGESRLSRFQEIKKLYGLRSKAVHGDKLSDDKMSEAMLGSLALLRDLLILTLSRGRALTQEDFDKAVFL